MANYIIEFCWEDDLITDRARIIGAAQSEEQAVAKFRQELQASPQERHRRPMVTAVRRSMA